MNIPTSKPVIVVILVALGTLIAQIPAITKLLTELTVSYPHLAFLAEGIIGVIAVLFAGSDSQSHPGAKP